MGVRTQITAYDKYVEKCKKDKIKPMDLIDFIMYQESQMRLWFKRLFCRHNYQKHEYGKEYYDYEAWLQCTKCGKQKYEEEE